MRRPRDFMVYAAFAFLDDLEPDSSAWADLAAKPQASDRLRRLADTLASVEPFEHDPIEKAVRGLAADLGVKAGEVIMPARIALTGKKVTPGIFDVILLLGRERSVARLWSAAERLARSRPPAADGGPGAAADPSARSGSRWSTTG